MGGERQQALAETAGVRGWVAAWRLPSLLFALTVFSTLLAGASKAGSPWTLFDLPMLLGRPSLLLSHLSLGVPFSAAMMSILGAHEMGHYAFARRHGIDATPPYFIPFPTLLGTMGAVIRLRGTLPTRTAVVDVGASGPIAGFLVALPLLFVGLANSTFAPLPPGPLPAQTIPRILGELWRSDGGAVAVGLLVPGESLLVAAARQATLGAVPAGHYLVLDPVAWAAVFGLFVTALNLLPIGQLDGGHALYALAGGRARAWGRVVVGALVVLGLFAWPGWLLWAVLAGKVIGTGHPPVDFPQVALPASRKLVAAFSLVLLPLTFAPVPVFVR